MLFLLHVELANSYLPSSIYCYVEVQISTPEHRPIYLRIFLYSQHALIFTWFKITQLINTDTFNCGLGIKHLTYMHTGVFRM